MRGVNAKHVEFFGLRCDSVAPIRADSFNSSAIRDKGCRTEELLILTYKKLNVRLERVSLDESGIEKNETIFTVTPFVHPQRIPLG